MFKFIAEKLRFQKWLLTSAVPLNSGVSPRDINSNVPTKAKVDDFLGRFREIVSDPINLLIQRDAFAGCIESGMVILHNGIRVPTAGEYAYYGDFSHILVINRGVHEPLEEFCFQEVLKILPRNPIMLELGAYWGHYSMWCQKVHSGAKTFLVEPELHHLEIAKRNFACNKLKGTFIQALVGLGHFSVDEFMQENSLPNLAILHSDIQGFELQMLQGAKQNLEKHSIDYCFISTHSDELHEGCKDFLLERGYAIAIEADCESKSTSYDGFVLASSPKVKAPLQGFNFVGREEISKLQAKDLKEFISSVRY
jgi:Methyltransferase FkbM domain